MEMDTSVVGAGSKYIGCGSCSVMSLVTCRHVLHQCPHIAFARDTTFMKGLFVIKLELVTLLERSHSRQMRPIIIAALSSCCLRNE